MLLSLCIFLQFLFHPPGTYRTNQIRKFASNELFFHTVRDEIGELSIQVQVGLHF